MNQKRIFYLPLGMTTTSFVTEADKDTFGFELAVAHVIEAIESNCLSKI